MGRPLARAEAARDDAALRLSDRQLVDCVRRRLAFPPRRRPTLMLPMSTLPLPQREREKIRLEPPLTAEGPLRRRALQRLDGAALFDPPNRSIMAQV